MAETQNEKFNISDVIGSLRFGRWDKKYVVLSDVIVVIGVILLLIGVILCPILYVDHQFTLSEFIFILVTFALMGLFSIILSCIYFVKIKKGKALLRRCLEENDLQRSSADVIVTTESSFIGRGRDPAVITLRFKLNGKKYEKKNIQSITYVENYYKIDILYSIKYDEVFLLKLN